MAGDDEVVQEMDVYLCKPTVSKMYMLEYPLRQSHFTLDHASIRKAKIKVPFNLVELEVGVDTQTANFDTAKGEHWAATAQTPATATASPRGPPLDTQTLASHPQAELDPRYAVGYFSNGQLHLTPLDGLLQLRPSLAHCDRVMVASKEKRTDGASGTAPAAADATAVSLRFGGTGSGVGGESEWSRARREASRRHTEERLAATPWQTCRAHAFEPDTARDFAKATLRCALAPVAAACAMNGGGGGEEDAMAMDADVEDGGGEGRATKVPTVDICESSHDYLRRLTPSQQKDTRTTWAQASSTISMNELKKMELPERIRALLINGKVLSFDTIVEVLRQACPPKQSASSALSQRRRGSFSSQVVGCGFAGAGGSRLAARASAASASASSGGGSGSGAVALVAAAEATAQIIRHLPQSAVLVRGCWAVRSELLHPPDTYSAHSGVPAELLCRARDYVLWKFAQGKTITRKEISSLIKLPAEEVTEILRDIAVQRRPAGDKVPPGQRRRWHFVHNFDHDFVRKHPDLVHQQEMFWETRINQLCNILKIDKARLLKPVSSAGGVAPVGGARRRTRSERRSSCSDQWSSDMEVDQPPHPQQHHHHQFLHPPHQPPPLTQHPSQTPPTSSSQHPPPSPPVIGDAVSSSSFASPSRRPPLAAASSASAGSGGIGLSSPGGDHPVGSPVVGGDRIAVAAAATGVLSPGGGESPAGVVGRSVASSAVSTSDVVITGKHAPAARGPSNLLLSSPLKVKVEPMDTSTTAGNVVEQSTQSTQPGAATSLPPSPARPNTLPPSAACESAPTSAHPSAPVSLPAHASAAVSSPARASAAVSAHAPAHPPAHSPAHASAHSPAYASAHASAHASGPVSSPARASAPVSSPAHASAAVSTHAAGHPSAHASAAASAHASAAMTPAEAAADLDTFVRERLSARLVVSLTDLQNFYRFRLRQRQASGGGSGADEADASAAAAAAAADVCSSREPFDEAADRLGASRLGNPEQHGTPVYYAWVRHGDDLDPLREVLISMFVVNPTMSTSLAAFRKFIDQANLAVAPDDPTTRKIFKQYTVHSRKKHFLKGTIDELA